MSSQSPVAIVMGSDSDLPTLEKGIATLKELGIGVEVRVLSAHSTPDALRAWLAAAVPAGLKVVIAAAGGAAHLAGTVAAHATIPVLGVPIPSGSLNGLDALLATVQMPPGVPVGTLGIGEGGAINAALFAAEILALADPARAERVRARRAADAAKVAEKDRKVREKHGA